MSWSGEKKNNSYKMLSIVDHMGHYIFARVSLGKNHREILMSCPLHLQEGLLMVVLMVMADFVALIRIQTVIKLSSYSILPGVKFKPVWRIAIRGLGHGSIFLLTIKTPIFRKCMLLAIHAAVM
jgi:hypothetical protein